MCVCVCAGGGGVRGGSIKTLWGEEILGDGDAEEQKNKGNV